MTSSKLMQMYHSLPVTLQHGVVTVVGLRSRRIRYGKHLVRHLSALKRSEWWTAPEIEAWQYQNLHQILQHAYDSVPFYRNLYDSHGVSLSRVKKVEDLKLLPVITKEDVRDAGVDMVSSHYKQKELQSGVTSGTTGSPLRIYKTVEAVQYQWAIWWRHKARFGLHLRDQFVSFGAQPLVHGQVTRPPYWRHDIFNRRVYLNSWHFTKDKVGPIVDHLNSHYYDFYTGYPAAIFALASLIEASGLRVYNRPKHIITGADALLSHQAKVIGRVFGAPVTDQYGMAEFAGNMATCEYGRYHVDFECGYIEAIPQPGTDLHRLILTGWGNDAMPFIRYDIGDLGVPSSEPCPCGRQSEAFDSIDGRLQDYVLTPDGARVIGINQIVKYAVNAKAIQVYQRTRKNIEFRVVPGSKFGVEDKASLEREFRHRAGNSIEVEFRIVDHLETGANGKVRSVIRHEDLEKDPADDSR